MRSVAALGRPTTNVEAIIADPANNVTPNQAQTDALNQELALYWRIAQSVLAQATGASTTTVAPTTATTTPSSSASSDGSASTQPAAVAAAITIQNFSFGPSELTVPAGTTLTVTNADSDAHTLTADDGSFDTGRIDPGASATITLDQPGTYTYHCNFHESMTGTITVT